MGRPTSSRTWLVVGLVLLAGAYLSFGWELVAADRELRAGGLTWREPVLVAAAAVCLVVSAAARRRRARGDDSP